MREFLSDDSVNRWHAIMGRFVVLPFSTGSFVDLFVASEIDAKIWDVKPLIAGIGAAVLTVGAAIIMRPEGVD